jgi:tRNA G46 methylase TrmB
MTEYEEKFLEEGRKINKLIARIKSQEWLCIT